MVDIANKTNLGRSPWRFGISNSLLSWNEQGVSSGLLCHKVIRLASVDFVLVSLLDVAKWSAVSRRVTNSFVSLLVSSTLHKKCECM